MVLDSSSIGFVVPVPRVRLDPVNDQKGVMRRQTKIVAIASCLCATLLALYSLHCSSAEKKQWSTLKNCRFLPHPSNDGDSFLINCGTEEFFARLYFVDALEPNLSLPERTRDQAEYFGVSLDETIKAGARATALVRTLLEKRVFVIYTRKALAQGRGRSLRYYALVQIDGRFLHQILLSEGLARNKGTAVALPNGEKAREHVRKLQTLEDRARLEHKGLWATSRSGAPRRP